MRVILAGAAVVVLVAGTFLMRPDSLAKADNWACDLLTGMVSRGKLSGKVAIVEIDETSLAQFGRWPWPRDFLAVVVRRILDDGAAVVVLDTMLNTEDRGAPSSHPPRGNPAFEAGTNDAVLAGVLQGKPVVPGYAFRFDGSRSDPSTCALQPLPLAIMGAGESWRAAMFHATSVLCTVPRISGAAADNGFLNAAVDSDGKLRRVPLMMEYGDREYPSLALAGFNVYRRASPAGLGTMRLSVAGREASSLRLGTQVVPLEGRGFMRLRFRGGRRTFPYASVAGLLNDRLPEGMLRGRIAVVGGSAMGLPNPVATPLDPQFPDVEVQATALDNLIQGDSFQRPSSFLFWEFALALITGLGATFLLVLGRIWWSAWIVLGIAAAMWAGSATLLSLTGLLLSPLPVTAALVCSFPVVTVLSSVRDKRKAERMKQRMKQQLASERELAQEVLRDSESRYQRLVENVNDAIIVDDAEGRLVFANRRFREWFGLEGRDIREVVLDDCIAPEWRAPLHDRRIRRMNCESVPDQYEFEGIRHDGKRIWIEALVTNVEEDGRIVGTQAALRDVTERRQIEAQYLQAQKMESIGRLAGGIAHDFNNLLTVINGFSELLLNQEPDEDYSAGLKEIRAAGERAAELTRNLLTFSRKQVAQLKPVDLNHVVTEAQKICGQLIGEDIELVTRLSPTLGRVLADAGQLHQILMNLLVNARDAMPGGGRIVIETDDVETDANLARVHPDLGAGTWVYLGVTDTGTGMSEEVRRRVFEPFFTTKEPGKGTGLGLATIYGIVQQCGGRIEVTSKLGEGTTFHIYFPRIASERSAQSGTMDSAAVTQGSGTILIVEDQDAVRRYLFAVLRTAGYDVLQAANGPDALALAERFAGRIDLLVTDLIMPLMNGRDLAEKLNRTRPRTKVLFISGYAEGVMVREIVADGLSYLPKPLNSRILTAKVREALANREIPRSIDRAAGTAGMGI